MTPSLILTPRTGSVVVATVVDEDGIALSGVIVVCRGLRQSTDPEGKPSSSTATMATSHQQVPEVVAGAEHVVEAAADLTVVAGNKPSATVRQSLANVQTADSHTDKAAMAPQKTQQNVTGAESKR